MGWGRGHEIVLSLVLSDKIKPSRLSAFLASRTLDELEAVGAEGVARRLGLGDDDLCDFAASRDRAEALARDLESRGIGVAARCDPWYPALVREIGGAPPLLFLRGSLVEGDSRAVAIVGSRRPSLAGLRLASQLAGDLAARGFTIVSGLARGIDSAAHLGALDAGGRTIAVLGSGIDVVYPPENAGLADRIVASGAGAVVSEFPPGSRPLKHNFPRRNRLVSGLALGTVVVEAGEKSGALITAGFALDQNRTVFAVPASPGQARTRGSNRLLKEGARLVETADDILEDLAPQLAWPGGAVAPPAAPPPGLAPDERLVVALLSDAPVHVDEVARHLEWKTPKVLGLLLGLETRGLVRGLAGKFYVKGGEA
jgi:DNA processing protein